MAGSRVPNGVKWSRAITPHGRNFVPEAGTPAHDGRRFG